MPDASSSAPPSAPACFCFNRATPPVQLDVRVLHERLLRQALGIGEEAVRDEKNLRYVRGLDAALEAAAAAPRKSPFCSSRCRWRKSRASHLAAA